MNVKLLRKVAKHISEEPRRLDMNDIAILVDPERPDSPRCGTVGCIAGWSCLLSGFKVHAASWHEGRELLRLSGVQAERLFSQPALALYGDQEEVWPQNFARQYMAAANADERVAVTVARIEHFIKTKGKE